MRLYRNGYKAEGGLSAGFEYFATKKEALDAARVADEDKEKDDPERTDPIAQVVEVVSNKKGILWAMNHYAGHADNG